MKGKFSFAGRHFPCLSKKKIDTINRVEAECEHFDFLMDMFIFLFGSVHFLLLFLLATVKIASHVHIRIFCEGAQI